MLTAVVMPARNESENIIRALDNARALRPDMVIAVVNGCEDATLEQVLSVNWVPVFAIESREPLGIDVPRAVGAKFAYDRGAEMVVFLDADMTGSFGHALKSLAAGMAEGTDLGLLNCYPYVTKRLPMTEKVLYFRELLNTTLGLFRELGLASPSHGPHAVSRHLLSELGFKDLAVPPVELAVAATRNLDVRVLAALPHGHLSSTIKNSYHARMVAETIIGDCIEAVCLSWGLPRQRTWGGKRYDGYNNERRWDLLEAFLSGSAQMTVHKS